MQDNWISDRAHLIQASGIRKVFELARSLKNPVNLSIGQPDFDVPQVLKDAAKQAIDRGDNGYTVTQGIPELRERLAKDTQARLQQSDRDLLITAGTSGALTLAMLTTINPGDEVILFDPHFVSYPYLVRLAGGIPILIDTYPHFQIDLDKVRDQITPKTKAILFSSPANPTGSCLNETVLRGLAEIAQKTGILLISDEIYRHYNYDHPFQSVSQYHPETLVVDGFGKSYGITGWRLGYAHGPKALINEMAKLQQFTFVCAPSIVQYGALAAWDFDNTEIIAEYRRKRDRIYEALSPYFPSVKPGGAFYLFPEIPSGKGSDFVLRCIQKNLLIIPGQAFSSRDSHVRISYAATNEMIDRGAEIMISVLKEG